MLTRLEQLDLNQVRILTRVVVALLAARPIGEIAITSTGVAQLPIKECRQKERDRRYYAPPTTKVRALSKAVVRPSVYQVSLLANGSTVRQKELDQSSP